MGKVLIQGLRASSVIGAYAWERDIRQQLIIDLEMFTDMSAAGASDALEDAIDYADISRRVITEVEGASFQLLEALGAHLLTIIVDELGVTGVKLTIHKPAAVPEARTVGIQMQRGETF